MRKGLLILITIMIAILASTAWSVYKSTEPVEPRTETSLETPFYKNLYNERLKEEGDRTSRIEKLIKEGKLSSKPASHVKDNRGAAQ